MELEGGNGHWDIAIKEHVESISRYESEGTFVMVDLDKESGI